MNHLSDQAKVWLVAGIIVVLGLVAAVVVAITGGSAAPAASPAAQQPGAIIQLSASGFLPSTITVKSGTLVQWQNTTGTDRKLVANSTPANPSMSAQVTLGGGKSYSIHFNQAGTYNYYDGSNPTANVQVIVAP